MHRSHHPSLSLRCLLAALLLLVNLTAPLHAMMACKTMGVVRDPACVHGAVSAEAGAMQASDQASTGDCATVWYEGGSVPLTVHADSPHIDLSFVAILPRVPLLSAISTVIENRVFAETSPPLPSLAVYALTRRLRL